MQSATNQRLVLQWVGLYGMLLAALPGPFTGKCWAHAFVAAGSGTGPSRLESYGQSGSFHAFSSEITKLLYQTVTAGGVFGASAYLPGHVEVQLERNFFPEGPDENDCVYSAQAGPISRTQHGSFVPLVRALGGAAKPGGPASQTCSVWGWGVTGGGGWAHILPVFNDRVVVRSIQGGDTDSRIDNGPTVGTTQAGVGKIDGSRLATGVMFRLGDMMPRERTPVLNCSAEPAEVLAGEAVMLSTQGLDLPESKRLRYQWSVSGGNIVEHGSKATVDTKGLVAGSYSASARLVDEKKVQVVASCTTNFAIETPAPPTISCSASRAAINSGDPVTITAVGSSPSGRPLTYAYSSTNGQVEGHDTSALLSTHGATPGAITVTCMVTDDLGRTASATASVVVATPVPPPPSPTIQRLCSLSFERDRRRPDRVDNEAKGCLDEVALDLQRDAGAKLLIAGHHDAREASENAAARALNAGEYLTREKGIDPARLKLMVSDRPSRSVDDTLIPAGATLDYEGVTGFDATRIRRRGEAYGRPGTKRAVVRRYRKRRRVHRT